MVVLKMCCCSSTISWVSEQLKVRSCQLLSVCWQPKELSWKWRETLKTNSIPPCQHLCCYILNILYRMYIKHVHTSEMNLRMDLIWQSWLCFILTFMLPFVETMSPKPRLGQTLTGGATITCDLWQQQMDGAFWETIQEEKLYYEIWWKHNLMLTEN